METSTKHKLEEAPLRNEEVQEIMGRMPRGILWWNVGITLAVVVLFLLGSRFFHSPIKMEIAVTITAYPEPAALTSPMDGTLTACFVTNGADVQAGQAMAIVATDSDSALLKAPTTGRFEAERLYLGRRVSRGDTLLHIIPSRTAAPVCYGYVPAAMAGDVQGGQEVRLRITGYPESDYGFIPGIIAHVASLPVANGAHYVEIQLPASLTTNNGKAIPFSYGMSGQAEIVTGTEKSMKLLP